MMHFLFTEGQRVKVKDTGQTGTVVYRGAVGPTDTLFYSIEFDDGKRKEFAEDELLPE